MKPSEIFEGENSSLRKTFDKATQQPERHLPDCQAKCNCAVKIAQFKAFKPHQQPEKEPTSSRSQQNDNSHPEPSEDWEKRLEEKLEIWLKDDGTAIKKDEPNRIGLYYTATTIETAKLNIKDFILSERTALVEWAKSTSGATAIDARGRRFIDLDDLIAYLTKTK